MAPTNTPHNVPRESAAGSRRGARRAQPAHPHRTHLKERTEHALLPRRQSSRATAPAAGAGAPTAAGGYHRRTFPPHLGPVHNRGRFLSIRHRPRTRLARLSESEVAVAETARGSGPTGSRERDIRPESKAVQCISQIYAGKDCCGGRLGTKEGILQVKATALSPEVKAHTQPPDRSSRRCKSRALCLQQGSRQFMNHPGRLAGCKEICYHVRRGCNDGILSAPSTLSSIMSP